MTLIISLLVLAAAPAASPLQGLDKPKKEQRATLGEREHTTGRVTIHCVDVGASMLVEINDPGLVGARDVWLKKKTGDVLPLCDAVFKGKTGMGTALISLPAEVDLTAPKKVKYRPGAATCAESV